MEKLTISQASKQFGISRSRIYQLLDKGMVGGYLSRIKNKEKPSWVLAKSLQTYLNSRNRNGGRPKIKIGLTNDDYIPARIAAEKSGYALRHIYYLTKQGSLASKKVKTGLLVSYSNLLNYKRKV